MNQGSCDCRRVEDFEHCKEPGDFYIKIAESDYYGQDTYMMGIRLPDGTFNNLPIRKGPAPNATCWGWDGNFDKPTTQPSIHCIDHWHGYLRAGRLESC